MLAIGLLEDVEMHYKEEFDTNEALVFLHKSLMCMLVIILLY